MFEPLRFRQGLEFLQGVVLDLPDALARDAECLPDLLQRVRLLSGEAVAELENETLALTDRNITAEGQIPDLSLEAPIAPK